MIPEGFISSLLERADIVDVIGRYVTLKKSGRNFMACCPFHKEKTPSFSVSPSKQIFKCFGCGKAGNAIGFLMDIEHLEFPEAVRRLADIYGMQVPEDNSPHRQEERARAKTLGEYMKEAADFYSETLKATPRAIDYLKQREITGETALRFGLGFSPDGWHGLQAIFPGEKYLAKELLEVGLVFEKNGSRYDAFRGRIMFPIRSPKGLVIGFGARTMKGDEQPKYLNSPETPIYHKGSELYGLYEGRSAVIDRARAIVCEGYMDVIQLSQAGFREAVAALGTSITPEHVKKLFKLTDTVYFSFDGDSAGRKAARRALEAALPVIQDGQAARFVLLPPEHDPDSLIKAEGAEGYEREIEKALPLTEFLKSLLIEGKSLTYAEERVKLTAEAKPLILSMKQAPVLRLALMREIARLARLQLEDLEREWNTGAPERTVLPPMDISTDFGPAGQRWNSEPTAAGRFSRWGGAGSYGRGWQPRRQSYFEPRVRAKDVRERMLQCFLAYPALLSDFTPQIEDEFVTSESASSQYIVEVWRAAAHEDGSVTNTAALLACLEKSPNYDHYARLLAEEMTIETPQEAARLELKRGFLELELDQVKDRLLKLSEEPATADTLAKMKPLAKRSRDIEALISEAAEEEKDWRRRAEEQSRTAAFAQSEKGRADVAYSNNPKVRALQEHLFGKAAMDEAAKTALSVREPTAAQTSVAAVAARNGAPATHPPRSAGKSENTQVSSTQTSAVAARAARVFGSFGAPPPSGGALGVHPLNAGVSAPAAAVPVQSARSRRDEIAAALTAQAEKRTGRTLQTNDEFMSEESSSGPMPEPPKGLTDLPSDAELAGWSDDWSEAEEAQAEPQIPADMPPSGLGRKAR